MNKKGKGFVTVTNGTRGRASNAALDGFEDKTKKKRAS